MRKFKNITARELFKKYPALKADNTLKIFQASYPDSPKLKSLMRE